MHACMGVCVYKLTLHMCNAYVHMCDSLTWLIFIMQMEPLIYKSILRLKDKLEHVADTDKSINVLE